ncbi:MAG: AAA family ATPase [Gammaproteobacteria bacterium]|nr:AAA family ATPase [Gammaproteobacteria bacterium]
MSKMMMYEQQTPPQVRTICAADIAPEPIRWLWHEYLAAGKLHILAGSPGTGKTTIALALAATVTAGERWPDGTPARAAGSVVIWSGEDDLKDTLVPRMHAMGADLRRVHFVHDTMCEDGARAFDPAKDTDGLVAAVERIGDVRLLIVDPIVSAVSSDSHKNGEVRRALQPLVDLAAAAGAALIGITHFTKSTSGKDPIERITGSLAFGALARVVFAAAKQDDEDGTTSRIFCRVKSNIGPDGGGYEYDLRQVELASHPGIMSSAVAWGGVLQGSARDLLAAAEPDESGGGARDAERFLADLLADQPMPVKKIKAEADDAGWSWAAIRRAQKALGVQAIKEGYGGKGRWVWRLPAAQTAGAAALEEVEI